MKKLFDENLNNVNLLKKRRLNYKNKKTNFEKDQFDMEKSTTLKDF